VEVALPLVGLLEELARLTVILLPGLEVFFELFLLVGEGHFPFLLALFECFDLCLSTHLGFDLLA
jgi:hypothetical protein